MHLRVAILFNFLLWALIALFATKCLAQRPTTFAWDAGTGWPAGTTIELCGTGNVCRTGITGSQATLDLPVQPGQVIEGRARAHAPATWTCTPAPGCRTSDWGRVSATWPMGGTNASARAERVPFLNRDVGDSASGGVVYDATRITILGNGADIWETADAFHFVYQPSNGDGSITARVIGLTHTNEWAKAGVMIRESLAAGSRHAMVVVTAENGVAFQRRVTHGGASTHTAGASVVAPYWVRLTRTGNVFTAHQSANGTTWTQVGTATIAMPAAALVGLAVTSHDATRLTTATFDSVIVK